jgi:hypothetical protein
VERRADGSIATTWTTITRNDGTQWRVRYDWNRNGSIARSTAFKPNGQIVRSDYNENGVFVGKSDFGSPDEAQSDAPLGW